MTSHGAQKPPPAWLTRFRTLIMIAFAIVCAFVVALVILFNKASDEKDQRLQLATKAAADTRARSEASVASCFAGVVNAPIIKGFLDGQKAITNNSILSTEAALALTPVGSKFYVLRQKSLARLLKAQANNEVLSRLILKTTPTIATCTALAQKLDVPVPKPDLPKKKVKK